MLLSDRDLMAALGDGRLHIDPPLADQINADPGAPSPLQPASLDVTLGNHFRVFNSHLMTCIDPRVRQDDLTRLVEVPEGDPFVLHPDEFVLGSTVERVTLDASLSARLEGKSSLGRLGLLVHSTAGFIDPGFTGRVTLELSNVANLPIMLWPGMKIGQLCVLALSSPADRPYGTQSLGSRYQDQGGPVASRSWLSWTESWAG